MKKLFTLAATVAISLALGTAGHAGGINLGDTTYNQGGTGIGVGIGIGGAGGQGGNGGNASANNSIKALSFGGSSASNCSYAIGPIAGPTKTCNDIMRTNAVLDCLDETGVKRTVCVKGLSKRSKFMRELLIEAGALVVK